MNPLFAPREVEYHLAGSGASMVVEMLGDVEAGAKVADIALVDGTDRSLLALLNDVEPDHRGAGARAR